MLLLLCCLPLQGSLSSRWLWLRLFLPGFSSLPSLGFCFLGFCFFLGLFVLLVAIGQLPCWQRRGWQTTVGPSLPSNSKPASSKQQYWIFFLDLTLFTPHLSPFHKGVPWSGLNGNPTTKKWVPVWVVLGTRKLCIPFFWRQSRRDMMSQLKFENSSLNNCIRQNMPGAMRLI